MVQRMKKKWIYWHGLLWAACACIIWVMPVRAETQSDPRAREMFDKVFQLVFGPQGSSLTYKVDIIGIYQTEGDIVYKNKKMQYQEKRYASWNDGVTAYMVDKKKKTVNVYSAHDDKKDAYLSKFKYNVDDFIYTVRPIGDDYEISAKLTKANALGIKEVKGIVAKSNLHPKSLRIKVSFFWTVVDISNFKSGGINDKDFVFPEKQFQGYQFIDHRTKE